MTKTDNDTFLSKITNILKNSKGSLRIYMKRNIEY